jgi:hypothetical protein
MDIHSDYRPRSGVSEGRLAAPAVAPGARIIPEPASLTLLGLGLAGFAMRRLRRVRGRHAP